MTFQSSRFWTSSLLHLVFQTKKSSCKSVCSRLQLLPKDMASWTGRSSPKRRQKTASGRSNSDITGPVSRQLLQKSLFLLGKGQNATAGSQAVELFRVIRNALLLDQWVRESSTCLWSLPRPQAVGHCRAGTTSLQDNRTWEGADDESVCRRNDNQETHVTASG